MARRKKSYLSASNKGKAGKVFVNNFLVNLSNNKKKKAVTEEKATALVARKRASEEKKRVNERVKLEKKQEKEDKKKLKEQERYAKYMARARLACEKFDIDEICCTTMVQEAQDAECTIAQVSAMIVKGREEYWHEKTVELHENKYLFTLFSYCEKTIQEGLVLERFSHQLFTDMTTTRPEVSELDTCASVETFIKKSIRIREDIDTRLNGHINTPPL